MVWDRGLAALAAGMLGYARPWSNCQALGFLDAEGAVEAVVVYHNWSPESGTIELSAASTHRGWLDRARLRAVFAYPFDVCGCRLAVARIAEGNARARRIWRRLGASEHVIPELRGPGEAEVIYLLAAGTWRASPFARS